jgi:hypothetical protein
MQVGPACNPVAPAREISVVGSYFPLQNDLDVALQADNNSSSETVPTTVTPATGQSAGRRLFTMDPLNDVNWMVFDIRPVGTIIRPSSDPAPTIAEVNGTAQAFTFAKARITWQVPGSGTRQVDVDINAGLSFTVPPCNQASADLLIPSAKNLGFLNFDGKPESFPTFGTALFYTTVSCKVTCVASPARNNACLTRSVYLSQEVQRQRILIPRGARRLQITRATITGIDGPLPNVIATLDVEPFQTGGAFPASFPVTPAVLAVTPSARVPVVTDTTGSFVQIPGGYNAVTVNRGPNEPDLIVTATFCLDI